MTSTPHLQPLLHDAQIALSAPTQVWSRDNGDIGPGAIDGVFHGDTRFLRRVSLSVGTGPLEHLGTASRDAGHITFHALLRGLDDASADPKVRLRRERTVTNGEFHESITISSHLTVSIDAEVRLRVEPEFDTMHAVKAGLAVAQAWDAERTGSGMRVTSGRSSADITADADAEITQSDSGIDLAWSVTVPARGAVTVQWSVQLSDPELVVRAPSTPMRLSAARELTGGDDRADRWLARALHDLDALRLTVPDDPDNEFYAAGAPWFLTLFGRDSLWAARLSLSADPTMAASTLRVLARLQGQKNDPDAAEEPGKILHELRASTFEIPSEDVHLPPRYFGTVDATALWVCLLGDAVVAGMPDDEVRALLPALRGCLDWILGHGDHFLSYQDLSGRGLANQGWKDSGDSIQWSDGSLAAGPIALCEVQAYAYEAAIAGAAVLNRVGEPGADEIREWAERLRTRFAESFWVETDEGRYPAIALDSAGDRVDTLTSNIGHLLGTGILTPDEERDVADLLVGQSMLSGFGIRTMSTGAGGYWPLSYHGGSVWIHDTAIAARGMLRAGLIDHAQLVVDDMLRAAAGFDYRVPELHAGDGIDLTPQPLPYPAACRVQAWSAAAAVTAAEVLAAGRH